LSYVSSYDLEKRRLRPSTIAGAVVSYPEALLDTEPCASLLLCKVVRDAIDQLQLFGTGLQSGFISIGAERFRDEMSG
jgi:hypothetical protein